MNELYVGFVGGERYGCAGFGPVRQSLGQVGIELNKGRRLLRHTLVSFTRFAALYLLKSLEKRPGVVGAAAGRQSVEKYKI